MHTAFSRTLILEFASASVCFPVALCHLSDRRRLHAQGDRNERTAGRWCDLHPFAGRQGMLSRLDNNGETAMFSS